MRETTKLGTSLYIETQTGWTFAVLLTKSTIRFAAVLCVLFVVLVPNLTAADGWLQFRGPGGLGVSEEMGLPVTWSAGQNLVWKTELPGAGASSPIVIGDKIFLTCYSGYGTGVIYASPLLADGKLYYVSRENGMFVVAAEPRFQLLAHNTFADDRSIFNASPAVVESQLILRSNRCIYCIGTKQQQSFQNNNE